MDNLEKVDTWIPCMDIYKVKIQIKGSLDRLNFRVVVIGDLQNKEMIGDTRSPTSSIRNLKYFLVDAHKHKQDYTNWISLDNF